MLLLLLELGKPRVQEQGLRLEWIIVMYAFSQWN